MHMTVWKPKPFQGVGPEKNEKKQNIWLNCFLVFFVFAAVVVAGIDQVKLELIEAAQWQGPHKA